MNYQNKNYLKILDLDLSLFDVELEFEKIIWIKNLYAYGTSTKIGNLCFLINYYGLTIYNLDSFKVLFKNNTKLIPRRKYYTGHTANYYKKQIFALVMNMFISYTYSFINTKK